MTELKGVKAAQLELEKNIQAKFKGSTSELEECIERFHMEMKVMETRRNDVSVFSSSFNMGGSYL
jgi:hypothetical protein